MIPLIIFIMNSVVSYLKYLRDASRRISIGNQLETCLLPPRGTKKPVLMKDSENVVVTASGEQDKVYQNINRIVDTISTPNYHDYQLFCGVGLICGKTEARRTPVAGPLVFYQCELDGEDNEPATIIYDRPFLNLDLIATIDRLDEKIDEDDLFTSDQLIIQEEAELIIALQKYINEFTEKPDVELVNRIMNQLRTQKESFRNIDTIDGDSYFFLEECRSYQHKKASIFDGPLRLVNRYFYFAAKVPDLLSAYEALDQLVGEVEKGGIRNPMLQLFLDNVISGINKKIDVDIIEKINASDIDDAINEVPFSLSSNQIQAIHRAWKSPVSYIQGPPGTGKSYTIASIALSAISLGKRVLIVSQKEPALDVVEEKVNKVVPDCAVRYVKAKRGRLKEHVKALRIKYIKKSSYEVQFRYDERIALKNKTIEQLDSLAYHSNKHAECSFNFAELMHKYIELRDKISFIPSGHPIVPIEDKSIYNDILRNLATYVSVGETSWAADRYLKRVLVNLKNNFHIDSDSLSLSSIDSQVNDILEMSFAYYNAMKAEKRIPKQNIDEINHRKREAHKNYYQSCSNVLSSCLELQRIYNIHSDNLEKFENFFHWKRPDVIFNRMKEIDYNDILTQFPIWIAEIRHLGHLFPISPNLFDIVIVDEASQVNLAEIIPAFYRGKRICIVGDHQQLSIASTGLNFMMSSKLDQLLWQQHEKSIGIPYLAAQERDLLVSRSSILNFIRSEYYTPKPPETMLDEHYRSMPALAQYTNRHIYEDKLKIMTETGEKNEQEVFQAIAVDGVRCSSDRSVPEEVDSVLQIIFHLVGKHDTQAELFTQHKIKAFRHLPSIPSIGIISPIRNQVKAIIERLSQSINDTDWKKYDILVGTPEEFQGHERDVIIISLCIDPEQKRSAAFYSDQGRWNVMTSRAKAATYVVYSGLPPNLSSAIEYFRFFGIEPKQRELPQSFSPAYGVSLWSFDEGRFESDFERMVYDFLRRTAHKMNNNGAEIEIYNQVTTCGQKRLDFVLYNRNNMKTVALEVDGQYHFLDEKPLKPEYTRAHKERIEILERANWNILNTPYYCWYEGGWLAEDSPRLRKEQERLEKNLQSILL